MEQQYYIYTEPFHTYILINIKTRDKSFLIIRSEIFLLQTQSPCVKSYSKSGSVSDTNELRGRSVKLHCLLPSQPLEKFTIVQYILIDTHGKNFSLIGQQFCFDHARKLACPRISMISISVIRFLFLERKYRSENRERLGALSGDSSPLWRPSKIGLPSFPMVTARFLMSHTQDNVKNVHDPK